MSSDAKVLQQCEDLSVAVVEVALPDGSLVYNVLIKDSFDRPAVTIHCTDREAAETVYTVLRGPCICDVVTRV